MNGETMAASLAAGNSMCSTETEHSPIRVEIYVAEHCNLCAYAYEVAQRIRADFPAVQLSIINLSQTNKAIPESVFATPTYLLNGRLWSLGNPSPEDVQRRLSLALQK